MNLSRTDLDRRFKEATARRQIWERMWEDCIEFCMPARQSFFERSVGLEKTDRVFDETPVQSTAEFASRMQSAILPPGRRWFRFEVSELIPPNQRRMLQAQLDEITNYIYLRLMASNLDSEVHEAFMDIAIGTCAMFVSLDQQQNLVFKTAALPTVWLEEGPDGRIGAYFRRRDNLDGDKIRALYPNAKLPEDPEYRQDRYNLCEATVRDYTRMDNEVWVYRVWIEGLVSDFIVEEDFVGWGSCPWVGARWSATAEEWYGRGPLINLLPAIRSANLIRELIFENSELAIGGIWQYPNDGTINPDQLQIAPNTFIPKAPGSAGLEPLVSPSRFDIAEANLQDLRQTIKRGLFSEEYTPTGRTPLSAMEIAARQTDLANRIGSPFARIMGELVQPLIIRVARLYQNAGLIEMPRIDGRLIRVVSVSPLARAQKAEDIQRITGYIATMVNIMGPEVTGTYIKTEETAQFMGDLYEFPARLLHDNDSRVREIEKNQDLQQKLQSSLRTLPGQEMRQVIERGDIQGPM